MFVNYYVAVSAAENFGDMISVSAHCDPPIFTVMPVNGVLYSRQNKREHPVHATRSMHMLLVGAKYAVREYEKE